MNNWKIEICMNIFVADLSLGVVQASGLGCGLGPVVGPRGARLMSPTVGQGDLGPDQGA